MSTVGDPRQEPLPCGEDDHAEQALRSVGVTIRPFGGEWPHPDRAVTGLLLVTLLPDHAEVFAYARPEPPLTHLERQSLADWILEKLKRIAEHGPEPDGWRQLAGANAWQLFSRPFHLPDRHW